MKFIGRLWWHRAVYKETYWTCESVEDNVGLPFNVIQYWVLLNRITQVTGRELGTMYWSIDNAHIYDRHLDVAEKQVTADISELEKTEPKLILPESLDFFRTPLHEAKIINYKHNGNYKYEVAI